MSAAKLIHHITMAEHASEGNSFSCKCRQCGHSNSPSAEEMINKGVPADYPISKLDYILKCITCESTDIASFPVNSNEKIHLQPQTTKLCA